VVRVAAPRRSRRRGWRRRPEEIVTAALYLASDASGFTTGSLVRVDGGIA
jgi:NAD(P)-dependent dehydrogenase (short-subunit alcohol dehydrogenase family)